MAEKVARCGVTKEKGHLYYLGKDGNVWASKMARGSDKGGNAKKVADTNVTREKGWLYFVDKDGDVSIGEHDLYQIILKLLGIINSIEIKNLDTTRNDELFGQLIDEINPMIKNK